MNQPSLVIRYMDLFQSHRRSSRRSTAPLRISPMPLGVSRKEYLGCEDGQRSQFEVRYGGRTFFVYHPFPTPTT